MPPSLGQLRVILLTFGALIVTASIVTWSVMPSAHDRRQAARPLSADEKQVCPDVPTTISVDVPRPTPPERVSSGDTLPIKLRPLKGSLLGGESETTTPMTSSAPTMI